MTKGIKRKFEEDYIIMDMSHINTIIKAGSSYITEQNNSNLVQLERQLDLFYTVTANSTHFPFLKHNEFRSTECLALLVNLLNVQNASLSFMMKVLSVLRNLAQDEELNEFLHNDLNLTTCLANCITYIKSNDKMTTMKFSDNENLFFLKCLELIQLLTYGKSISYQGNYDELIMFLLQRCCRDRNNVELNIACLGVLTNFIRKNKIIQNRVKDFIDDQLKEFYKYLMENFCGEKVLGVYCLSVFANLYLYSVFGEKSLLNRKENINQTLAFAMNTFINERNIIVRNYAADLIIDLIQQTKIQERFILLPTLPVFLNAVLKMLFLTENKAGYKVLELLINLSEFKKVREVLCSIVFEKRENQSRSKSSILTQLYDLASSSVKNKDLVPDLAFKFLKVMYEELLSENLSPSHVSSLADDLLAIVEDTYKFPLNQKDSLYAKECSKITSAICLHILLLRNSHIMQIMNKDINVTPCLRIVNYIIDQFDSNQNQSICSNPLQSYGVELLLNMVYLLSNLKDSSAEISNEIKKILSDERVSTFVAMGMLSSDTKLVNVTIKLLNFIGSYSNHSFSNIAEYISSKNKKKTTDDNLSQRDMNQENYPSSFQSFRKNTHNGLSCKSFKGENTNISMYEIDSSIKILTEQVENCQVKDLHSAKIISLYEHRYRTLEANEKMLEDLIQSKDTLLDQQRRLIQQNASQRAILSAEVQELHNLLRDSEGKFEVTKKEVIDFKSKIENLNTELDECYEQIQRLQDLEDLEDKHKSLMKNHQEVTRNLETLQQSHALQKQQSDSKTSMLEMLQKHHDSAQNQLEKASQKIDEMKEDIVNTKKTLEVKEAKLSETSVKLEETETSLKKFRKQTEDLTKTADDLRKTLSQKDQKVKEFIRKEKDNEIVYKDQLKTINEQQDQLQQQKGIVDMIRNLTGK